MSQIKYSQRTIDDLQKLPIVGRQPKNEKEENFLREICEFEFLNLEEPNVSLTFSYGNSKDSHKFKFFPGGKYKIPRFVAQWVESRTTPVWDWRPTGLGSIEKKQVGNKPRFQMRQVYGE